MALLGANCAAITFVLARTQGRAMWRPVYLVTKARVSSDTGVTRAACGICHMLCCKRELWAPSHLSIKKRRNVSQRTQIHKLTRYFSDRIERRDSKEGLKTHQVPRRQDDNVQLDLLTFLVLEDNPRLGELLDVSLDDDPPAEDPVGQGVVDGGMLVPPAVLGLEPVQSMVEGLVGVRLVNKIHQPLGRPLVEEVRGAPVEERVRRDSPEADAADDPAPATGA